MSAPFFHWRDEAEPIRQGFNVYPLRSPYHLGGYLRIGSFWLYLRWSKKSRRLFRAMGWAPTTEIHPPLRGWLR